MAGLAAAVLAATGYALLETAFFARRNLLLPWEPRHVVLFLVFLAIHGAVALGALLATRALARRFLVAVAGTLPPFAPAGLLIAIHAVTHYRERWNELPRDLAGNLVTAGIVVAVLGATGGAGWLLRRRPGAVRAAALAVGGILTVLGAVRVATVEPVGRETVSTPRPAEDRLEAAETGQRVFVLGFDGATWDILDPMMAQGRLPNLAALAVRGRVFQVETIRPTFSPVIWTSIATGKDRFGHGIHDVVQTILPGGTRLPRSMRRTAFYTKTTGILFRLLNARGVVPRAPYRSGDVRATTVFEAASEAGLPTSLVEWYVTWPAVPLSGVTVSDRFHLQAPGAAELADLVAPVSLAGSLAGQVVTADDVPLGQVMGLVETSGLGPKEQEAWARKRRTFVREMRLNLARDLTTRNVAVDLLSRDDDWRLFGVYFRAVDLSHHLAWRYRNASGDTRRDAGLRLRSVVRRYHEFMDGIVGDVLAHVPDDAVILLLSDHGFEDRYAHSRAPDGFAILAGGPVGRAPGRGRISIYDVAPTVAVLLGLPVAEDLVGRPRLDLLTEAFRTAHPVRSVSTWDRVDRKRPAPATTPDAAQREEVERLRALGYIQ